MRLREWGWAEQAYVEIDYPDEIVREFVNKLRTNRQWRESPDPGRDVYSMWLRFEQQLADARARQLSAPPAPEPTGASVPSGEVSVAERMARVRSFRKPKEPKTA